MHRRKVIMRAVLCLSVTLLIPLPTSAQFRWVKYQAWKGQINWVEAIGPRECFAFRTDDKRLYRVHADSAAPQKLFSFFGEFSPIVWKRPDSGYMTVWGSAANGASPTLLALWTGNRGRTWDSVRIKLPGMKWQCVTSANEFVIGATDSVRFLNPESKRVRSRPLLRTDLKRCHYFDSTRALAITAADELVKTEDGKTWDFILKFSDPFRSTPEFFVRQDSVVSLVNNGLLIRSTDAGKNWISLDAAPWIPKRVLATSGADALWIVSSPQGYASLSPGDVWNSMLYPSHPESSGYNQLFSLGMDIASLWSQDTGWASPYQQYELYFSESAGSNRDSVRVEDLSTKDAPRIHLSWTRANYSRLGVVERRIASEASWIRLDSTRGSSYRDETCSWRTPYQYRLIQLLRDGDSVHSSSDTISVIGPKFLDLQPYVLPPYGIIPVYWTTGEYYWAHTGQTSLGIDSPRVTAIKRISDGGLEGRLDHHFNVWSLYKGSYSTSTAVFSENTADSGRYTETLADFEYMPSEQLLLAVVTQKGDYWTRNFRSRFLKAPPEYLDNPPDTLRFRQLDGVHVYDPPWLNVQWMYRKNLGLIKYSYSYHGTSDASFHTVNVTLDSRTDVRDGPASPKALALSVPYPHPISGNATISFMLPASMHVTLDVYSLHGVHVSRLLAADLEEGTHYRTLDVHALPGGVYLLRLVGGAAMKTQLLQIIHR